MSSLPSSISENIPAITGISDVRFVVPVHGALNPVAAGITGMLPTCNWLVFTPGLSRAVERFGMHCFRTELCPLSEDD